MSPTRTRAVHLAAVLGLALALVGCSGSSGGSSSGNDVPSPGRGPSAVGAEQTQPVAENLTVPWGLAFLPDGSALVAERDTARILQLPPGGHGPAREVMRITDTDFGTSEGGLLGLAVSPHYAQDQFVYAFYTTKTDNEIGRFRLGDSRVEKIFGGIVRGEFHDGGRIAFGPDGMLYVGTGDGTHRELAQDPRSPNGKILRLTPDGQPAPGNPQPGSPVYSMGHRNVQGLAWNSAGQLYAVEFGQNKADEVNVIKPGANYGWPMVEGVGDTQGGRLTNPIVTWPVAEASPSGAAIAGDALYVASLRGVRLWRVPLLGGRGAGTPQALLTDTFGRLRTVENAPDNSLWITTSNRDGRGDPRPGDDKILRFPPTN